MSGASEEGGPQIAVGTVWHRRLRPVAHEFRYPTCFLQLPLRRLRREPCAALNRNGRGWLSFHDRDHGDGGPDALAWFERLLAQEGITDADGEVWLQTFPRMLGYVFKPVSFWYAHRADGSLAAVLAEVNNTFGERHGYLLDAPAWGQERSARKVFHVSPFCAVDGEYRFRFERAGDRAVARVDLHDAEGPLLQTSVSGALSALTPARVRRAVLAMPFLTLGVVLRIHWQAARLWVKRVPFFTKPQPPQHFVSR
ncbi:DUF1365 domain-containing protein [Roseateles cellulosilyticus]|uniref:DUF1365 domain-containing protein n=1 Tax=Pelomonas cellulosilytica TaxID=2906762 RepID=A0ABS8XXU5_9BURK|nr:DUF1365 domain-containing protein [Pelomonas sp. P8]MCE4556505.1 DUF1365 domain-containing protein [Pelomonas sp. P8]